MSATARVTDRDLVRLYWPVELRPAFDALFDIDDAMGDVVMRASQPALAAIKLAWWRERLEELDAGLVPAEPRLVAAARELLPRGVSGAQLAEIEAGWATLLDERPEVALINRRGAVLFELGGFLLGADAGALGEAGALYASINVERRGVDDGRSFATAPGRRTFPAKVRPVTALAVLAARDLRPGPLESEGTPGRAWALLRHRWTGSL